MRPSPCCQPKSADARFGIALSCVWACAAAPTAREAISTAPHQSCFGHRFLLRYEVREYGLADADLPAVPLPTVRVPLYTMPLPARHPLARCRRGVEGDRTGDSGAFGHRGAAAP